MENQSLAANLSVSSLPGLHREPHSVLSPEQPLQRAHSPVMTSLSTRHPGPFSVRWFWFFGVRRKRKEGEQCKAQELDTEVRCERDTVLTLEAEPTGKAKRIKARGLNDWVVEAAI